MAQLHWSLGTTTAVLSRKVFRALLFPFSQLRPICFISEKLLHDEEDCKTNFNDKSKVCTLPQSNTLA